MCAVSVDRVLAQLWVVSQFTVSFAMITKGKTYPSPNFIPPCNTALAQPTASSILVLQEDAADRLLHDLTLQLRVLASSLALGA